MSWYPDGATRVAAVIGDPIRHSLSPAIHNAAFRELDLNWVYLAFSVREGRAEDALQAVGVLGLGGLSVTMPHKRAVADLCDELSDDARTLRSVNSVTPLANGRLRGDSTDGEGLVRSLRDVNIDAGGRSVLLVGAGGAARAVALALCRVGATVGVAARNPAASESVCALGKGIETVAWEQRDAMAYEADIVINCTPIGMLSDARLPIDALVLHPGQCVVDLVYQPIETPLLAAARLAGTQTVDGLGMLIHQAAMAFALWTGREPSTEAMRDAAAAALRQR